MIDAGIEAGQETALLPTPRRRAAKPVAAVALEADGRRTGDVVGYECIGHPGAPAVVVLGGISADAHVVAHDGDRRPGWWEGFVGSRCPIDTDRHRIIGLDWLGGPGSTRTSAPPAGAAAASPAVTPGDQAALLAGLLDALGIDRVDAVVGASYGGMVALAFAERFPRRLRHAVVISAADRTHPMATALRAIQREIVRFGVRAGREREALSLARQLAVTTYRTAAEFEGRFDSEPRWEDGVARFPVEAYLRHQGRRLADRFTAEQYLRLSESLDLCRVDPAAIRVPITLVSVEQDTLVPPWQMDQLRARLGGPAELVRIASRYGHDAFLKETASIGPVLRSVLDRLARGREVVR